MKTTITSAELMPMLEAALSYVACSTVGFVRAYQARQSREPGREDFVADLGGSGTLVQADGYKGILTADHVFDELSEQKPFGLVLPTPTGERHQQLIIEAARKVCVGRGTEDSQGPDLALLVLSPADAAKVEAQGGVFYNLAMRRARMLDQPPRLDEHSALILCGMVGEWTRDIPPEHGFEAARAFRGLFGPVVLATRRQSGAHDYLSVEVQYDSAHTGPVSYKGCSGGGLWHVELKKNADRVVEVGDPTLCGVPFYESGNVHGRGLLECHGIKSIYEVATDLFRPAC